MAFYGRSFSFNGIPCENFDLMLYNIGEHKNPSRSFSSCTTIVESTTAKRWKPIFCGGKKEHKIEFSLVFGLSPHRLASHQHLDSGEFDAIANWLTGHNEYRWLEIDQDDMIGIRYRAIITSLKVIEYGLLPWAFEATVVCDGPYAYQYPQIFEYDVKNGDTITFYNESTINDYVYPKIEVTISGFGTVGAKDSCFAIINQSDNNRTFELSSSTLKNKTIMIDNDLGIMTSAEEDNPYQYFNCKFLRLVNGYNILSIVGSGKLKITCEFPVNVGG